MGTDLTMMRGLRIFRSGGAWELDDEKLIIIRDMAQYVLTDRLVPSAKVVHYIVETRIGQGGVQKSLHSACRGNTIHSRMKLTSDNSTAKLEYVSCANCKTTKAFKIASGLIPETPIKPPPLHLNSSDSAYYGGTRRACDTYGYMVDAARITDTIADVTCGNCLKTKEFKRRSEPIHETVDHQGV
jgi:hypothetical protein